MTTPVLHNPQDVTDVKDWGIIPTMLDGESRTSGVLLHKGSNHDDCRCSARATSSLPVPFSPSKSTLARVGATRPICSHSARIGADVPTMS